MRRELGEQGKERGAESKPNLSAFVGPSHSTGTPIEPMECKEVALSTIVVHSRTSNLGKRGRAEIAKIKDSVRTCDVTSCGSPSPVNSEPSLSPAELAQDAGGRGGVSRGGRGGAEEKERGRGVVQHWIKRVWPYTFRAPESA